MTRPLSSRLLALGALALGLVALTHSAPALPAPPPHPAELVAWWSRTDPALSLGALLRLAAIGGCAWLLLVTAVELVATATGWRALAHLARGLAPTVWQVLVLRPIAVGTLAVPVLAPTAAMVAPTVAAAETTGPDTAAVDIVDTAGPGGPVVLTMTIAPNHASGDPISGDPLPADQTSTTAPESPTTSTTDPASPTPPTPPPPPTTPIVVTIPEDFQDHTLPPCDAVTPQPPTSAPAPSPAPTAPIAPPAPAPENPDADPSPDQPRSHAPTDTYVVVPGDSFWRIAAVRVEAHLGRVPTPSEIADHWRVLIAANQHRLAVPGNPDLIFPGDELLLPPL